MPDTPATTPAARHLCRRRPSCVLNLPDEREYFGPLVIRRRRVEQQLEQRVNQIIFVRQTTSSASKRRAVASAAAMTEPSLSMNSP